MVTARLATGRDRIGGRAEERAFLDSLTDPAELAAIALRVAEDVKGELADLKAFQLGRFDDRAALLLHMDELAADLRRADEALGAGLKALETGGGPVEALQRRVSDVAAQWEADRSSSSERLAASERETSERLARIEAAMEANAALLGRLQTQVESAGHRFEPLEHWALVTRMSFEHPAVRGLRRVRRGWRRMLRL